MIKLQNGKPPVLPSCIGCVHAKCFAAYVYWVWCW